MHFILCFEISVVNIVTLAKNNTSELLLVLHDFVLACQGSQDCKG